MPVTITPLDVGRLSALGWRARTSLREGIAQAYAAFTRSASHPELPRKP